MRPVALSAVTRRWHDEGMPAELPAPGFGDLKFEGGRFEQEGLPLAALREVEAYRDILVDIAKAVYFRDNPDRKRVPRGFESRFRLRLTEVRGGSVTPVLEREHTGELFLDDEFAKAAEFAADVVAAATENRALPTLDGFDNAGLARLGRTLRPSERLVLRASSPQRSVLGASARERLRSAGGSAVKEVKRLVGRVTEVDAARERFTLRLADSDVTCGGSFEASRDLPILRQLLTDDYTSGPLLALVAEVTFSGEMIPSRWDNVESATETTEEYERAFAELTNHLGGLTSLSDGWFDDVSKAPSAESVSLASEIATALQGVGLQPPFAFPTPDGGVSLEWIVESLQIGATIRSDGVSGDLSFWNSDTDDDGLEEVSALTPERVVEYLSRLVGDQNG